MKSETHKLPKGHSYVLKPSWLQSALVGSGITIDTHLIRQPSKRFFDASFWPSSHIPYDRLYVRAGTVPLTQAALAREFMQNAVLPELVGWLGSLIRLDSRSPLRLQSQMLEARFDGTRGEVFKWN